MLTDVKCYGILFKVVKPNIQESRVSTLTLAPQVRLGFIIVKLEMLLTECFVWDCTMSHRKNFVENRLQHLCRWIGNCPLIFFGDGTVFSIKFGNQIEFRDL